jgi:Polyketide cyclase / dehydrase and lipid transport
MAPIVRSIEIARRPEDVFSYATDFSRFSEWQEGVVSVRPRAEGPAVGSTAVVTRRVGPRTLSGPRRSQTWTLRGHGRSSL